MYSYPLNQLLHGIISQNKTPQRSMRTTMRTYNNIKLTTGLHMDTTQNASRVSSFTPFNLAGSMSSIDHKKQNGCLEPLMASMLL